MHVIIITIHFIIISIIIIIYIHLSGKGSLAPISALDQVGNMVLGAIIGGPLYNSNINVWILIVTSGAWAGLLLLARYLAFKLGLVKNAVDGHSIQLLKDGKIVTSKFGEARLSVRDFAMLLRQRGYPNINELANVWFDYNGQITAAKKKGTPIAVTLVEDSNINEKNVNDIGYNKSWLLETLAMEGYRLDEVFFAEWHDNKVWIYPYEKDDNSTASSDTSKNTE